MDLTGPAGALVLATAILGVAAKVIAELWGEHKRADADDRAERDAALAGWRDQANATQQLAKATDKQAAAIDRLASGIARRATEDATRRRIGDQP